MVYTKPIHQGTSSSISECSYQSPEAVASISGGAKVHKIYSADLTSRSSGTRTKHRAPISTGHIADGRSDSTTNYRVSMHSWLEIWDVMRNINFKFTVASIGIQHVRGNRVTCYPPNCPLLLFRWIAPPRVDYLASGQRGIKHVECVVDGTRKSHRKSQNATWHHRPFEASQ